MQRDAISQPLDDREVRLLFLDDAERGKPVCRFADKLEITLRLDQGPKPVQHDRMIVGEHDAGSFGHATALTVAAGMRAKIAVPEPDDDLISSSPPINVSRSRMPATPSPPLRKFPTPEAAPKRASVTSSNRNRCAAQ